MAEMRHRRTNLMQESGFELDLDQRRLGETLARCHMLPARMSTRDDFDMRGVMPGDFKGQIDSPSLFKISSDECQIGLLDSML